MSISDIFFGLLNGRCEECGKAIIYYKQEVCSVGPGCGPRGGHVTLHSDCSDAFRDNKLEKEPYISRTEEYKRKIGWYDER